MIYVGFFLYRLQHVLWSTNHVLFMPMKEKHSWSIAAFRKSYFLHLFLYMD